MNRRGVLSAFLLFPAAGIGQPIDVSLISLIARPSEFDGKLVRVIGFAHFEYEGNSIYLHKEDHLREISKNGLWLDVERRPKKEIAATNNRYVLVEGVFSMKDKGHLSLWSGSINKVSRLEPWGPE